MRRIFVQVVFGVLLCLSGAFGDVLQPPNQANMQRSNVAGSPVTVLADRFQVGTDQWAYWVSFWGAYNDPYPNIIGPNPALRDFTIEIWKDNGTGNLPANGASAGDILASFVWDLTPIRTGETIVGGWPEYGYQAQLWDPAQADPNPVRLIGGENYWLVIYHNSDERWAWERSSVGDNQYAIASSMTPPVIWSLNSGNWAWGLRTADAAAEGPPPPPPFPFPVPEPATMGLLTMIAMGLLGNRRRRPS